MRCSDVLPTIPPRFVAFAWRYHGVHSCFVPVAVGCASAGLELVSRCPTGNLTVETAGLPRFLGNPLSLCRVLRPRQDRAHQAIAVRRHGPRYVHNEGSHEFQLSRLNRTALGLAVYASSGAVARTRRKTRFRPLAKRYRTGLATRRVPLKGFRGASYISSSFPKLSWRKDIQGSFCRKKRKKQ